MNTIWRLQTNTDNVNKESIGGYCIDKGIIAMGWSLRDDCFDGFSASEKAQAIYERGKISSFEDYGNFVSKYGIYGGEVNENVARLSLVQPGDLVWIRHKGLYYLGQVTENSRYEYCCNGDALLYDAANRITNIRWFCIGDESDVPGGISNSFIPPMTFQRIQKSILKDFSRLIINERTWKEQYSVSMTRDEKQFFGMLTPKETEDLFICRLAAELGCILIPSSRKESTELYECVLVDTVTGKHIYPQVKSGAVDLCRDDFCHLPGDVWLFTTEGKITGGEYDNVFSVTPRELYEFAANPDNGYFLPPYMKIWFV